MNVSLTKELEQLVADKVKTGRYLSASEVVRDALRLLEERDRMQELKLDALRQDVRRGLDSGPSAPFDRSDLKQRARKKISASKRA